VHICTTGYEMYSTGAFTSICLTFYRREVSDSSFVSSVMSFSSMWMAVGVQHQKGRAELLSQCHFVHHKSEIEWPRIELGTRDEN